MTELEKNEILRLSNEESNALTRKCLQTAMGKMLARQSLEKISISELVRVAGVSRNAFYRNYESKEALVEEMCAGVTSWLKTSAEEWENSDDKEEVMISIFRFVRDNAIMFRILVDARRALIEKIELAAVPTYGEGPEHYLGVARAGVFTMILKEWFESGMKESPEEIGALCSRYVSAVGARR